MEAKKSPAADLENKKPYFTNIGLIISLSMMLIIFGWKTYDLNEIVIPEPPKEEPGGIIELPPNIPNLPKPPVVQPTLITIVENTAPEVQDVRINAEVTPGMEIPPYVPPVEVKTEEKRVDEEIFLIPDVMPEFPGGINVMYKFLRDNLIYPQLAKETGITGTVYLSFVVEKDGRVTDIRVQRGAEGGLTEEAIRVIQLMPNWKPGWKGGVPVRTQFSMPVKFDLR
jgi:periplasmic protein TonB